MGRCLLKGKCISFTDTTCNNNRTGIPSLGTKSDGEGSEAGKAKKCYEAMVSHHGHCFQWVTKDTGISAQPCKTTPDRQCKEALTQNSLSVGERKERWDALELSLFSPPSRCMYLRSHREFPLGSATYVAVCLRSNVFHWLKLSTWGTNSPILTVATSSHSTGPSLHSEVCCSIKYEFGGGRILVM